MRAGNLWSQVEAIYKQMDTAETELRCFQALQKQEQLAASNRINELWEEVQKQKELERTLQKRFGDLLAEKEKIQNLLEEQRVKAQIEEEIAANNRALQLPKDQESAMAKETMDVDVVDTEIVPMSTDKIDSIPEMVEGQLGEVNSDASSKHFEGEGQKDIESRSQEGMATNADGPVQGSEGKGQEDIMESRSQECMTTNADDPVHGSEEDGDAGVDAGAGL